MLSLWFEGRNLAVLSTTDGKFAQEIKEWAAAVGYDVREGTEEGEEGILQ